MAKCRLGILTLLFHVALVCAITWDAAPSTTFDASTLTTETLSQALSATPAPAVVINGTTYEPPNLCGYVEYSSGPHHNYSIFGCEATRIFGRYKVHLTYSGQTTTGHLPRYLGDDGVITYGTRIPKNTTSSSTSSAASTGSTDPFLVATLSSSVTDGTQPTGWGNGNWTACLNGSYCQTGKSRWVEAQIRTEIIAGSVIGGFMFLIAAGLLIWLFFAWRRLKKAKLKHESEPKDVRLQEMGRESVITSEASGSVGSSAIGSRRMSSRTVSISRDAVMRERDREEVRSPVSPVSEVGSAYMSRGTSTLEVYDEIYDDEDEHRGRPLEIPALVLSEAPENVPVEEIEEIYEAENTDGEGRLTVPVAEIPEAAKNAPADSPVEDPTEARVVPPLESETTTPVLEKTEPHAS
ncbi:uncharacterized protein LY89DRAFT_718601 [Mollisia scopiformis]|uniref:Uncharacterized protein n=1 Tax=Mollisia scopiformis TaxID=149040 RepID=A0A194X9M1_MOLSC|nr:uncharacterized protein LY89DRAFT_718601 [Mollisia scopiformis]KUJ16866.1 hypothetical protein LY89DRAFT_718601 [Mollisia scopiformis]